MKERPEPETVDTDWRMFLAVPLPPDVVERIGAIIAELEPRAWPLRWITPETAHLTLHFLGDTPPEEVEILRMALPAVIAEHGAFALRTAGLGVFPKLLSPRVLWLGLWGPAHRLESLYNDLGDYLDEMQFPIEEKPYQPHITLGRLRNTRNIAVRHLPEEIRKAIADLETSGLADPKRPLPVPIDEIHLIRSHLEQPGPRYEVIARFPLEHT
ncbi:MAG: RNA 2',3'-cyclic phosphodiesterase [Chloroflexota bacterium]|nr:RNA 2',3'-cyclic phosphodiesterase [Chloroflexota bacterium]